MSGTELKISTGIIRSNTTDGVAKWLEVHTESEVQMIWELEIGGEYIRVLVQRISFHFSQFHTRYT